ncbi:MAG TPA: hypothetical protein VGQ59_16875 [Cyclobacteriaceae bacterium]|jgi:hypothetical protein|nr:hypothetical protein [Cyclobacteriaceae bacterium]
MLRFVFVVLFSLFFLAQLKAQETGYQIGYIVTNENDTIKGMVKNKNLAPYRVLTEIKFKKNNDGKMEIFSPVQLKGFQIGPAKYLSVDLKMNGFNEKSFVEVIVEGYLNYYELESSAFGAGKSVTYVILQRKGEKKQVYYSKSDLLFNFKKTLTEYLKDMPNLCEKINDGTYKKKDIEKIVNEYNQ